MRVTVGSLESQFVNDIDPYSGSLTIPAPLAREINSDDAWLDFQCRMSLAEERIARAKPPGNHRET
jgi:hypothetical protein